MVALDCRFLRYPPYGRSPGPLETFLTQNISNQNNLFWCPLGATQKKRKIGTLRMQMSKVIIH